MRGLGATARLRFREAVAARLFWLVPLHFMIALPVAHAMPGPTPADRRAAADAVALSLAAILGVVAAAVLGAGPLPAERDLPRGALVRAAPVSPAARVLGTALGAGGALLLLAAALLASALAVVDLGAGAGPPPRAWVRATGLEGGAADPGEPGLVWLTADRPEARVTFPPGAAAGPAAVLVEARARVGAGGDVPGSKRLEWESGAAVLARPRTERATLTGPFRLEGVDPGAPLLLRREAGNFDLGLRADGIRIDAGPRPRAWARGLHAAALGAGLTALMAAALALSSFVGSGVGAAGGLVLALLSLSRGLFADAARMLAHAGSMERALRGTDAHGHLLDPVTGTPPALAPLFRALAAVLPDAERFQVGGALARGAVPDPGEVGRAAVLGLLLAALFLAVAVLGARRRP